MGPSFCHVALIWGLSVDTLPTNNAGCNQSDDVATRLPLLGWPKMRMQHRSCCAGRLLTPLWLGLAIYIALLCVPNAALAHDIYSRLRDRDGRLCCGGEDCKPVEATALPNGTYYLPESDEIIPADMAAPSPDERFHHCIYYRMINEFDRGGPMWEDKPRTRCFFAPMNSM